MSSVEDLRFRDTVPLKKFRGKTIAVAGLGATGKQVVQTLAVMGHKKMWGADPDRIERKNIGTQGWNAKNINSHKAHVIETLCCDNRSEFLGVVRRFEECFHSPIANAPYNREMPARTQVFFCCVDTMRARADIWRTLEGQGLLQGPKLWIDSRIASRVIRIITIDLNDGAMKEYYQNETLYSDTEAFQGACTDRMTYYGASIAAGLMVCQLVNWLNYDTVPAVDFVVETASMGITRIK